MIERSVKRLKMRVLVVDDELVELTAEGRAVRALVQELQGREIEVIEAVSAEDGTSVITSDSAIHALLIDWTLGEDGHDRARALTCRAGLRDGSGFCHEILTAYDPRRRDETP